jgi:hypothetical protein
MPTLIFSCAVAGVAATPSTTASPVNAYHCFIISLQSALQPKTDATPNIRMTAYSDGDRTCKPNASMQAMRQLLET